MTNKPSNTDNRSGKSKARYVLEDQVGHLLRRANQRHTAIFAASIGRAELTPTQFAALVKIRDCTEVSQNRLGRLTAMDPATVQGVVKRLKERRLIKDRPDPDDRRRSLWRLSTRGEKLLSEALTNAQMISATTLQPITASERKTLTRLLKKLSD